MYKEMPSVPVLAQTASAPVLNPTTLDRPTFVMNCPFSFSTDEANNRWMEDIPLDDRGANLKKAMVQFLELYRYMTSEGVVYLLPTPRECSLQDLVFTANLGVALEHLPDKNTVVVANFTSEPRRGETEVGVRFFELLGYETIVSPFRFEGEAELKHLRDNIYIGGYGPRSEMETYRWMEQTFDMRIVKAELVDPYLYHLDCSVFPITPDDTLVCTEMFEKDEVAEMEKVTNIIDVSADVCYSGICNSVRLANTILNASHLHELRAGTPEYIEEITKNRRLEDIAANLAFEVNYFNLSEYHKSGALLSCLVMHLNRRSYSFALL